MANQSEKNPLEKIPPHSLEAEESLLGSLLIDKDAIIRVADNILPQDFYKDAHKIILKRLRNFMATKNRLILSPYLIV